VGRFAGLSPRACGDDHNTCEPGSVKGLRRTLIALPGGAHAQRHSEGPRTGVGRIKSGAQSVSLRRREAVARRLDQQLKLAVRQLAVLIRVKAARGDLQRIRPPASAGATLQDLGQPAAGAEGTGVGML